MGKKSFVYLCVILDLFSRKVIALSVGTKINTELSISVLKKTVQSRKLSTLILFHTDRSNKKNQENIFWEI